MLDMGMKMTSYEIHYLTSEEMAEMQSRGYRNRYLTGSESTKPVHEIFEIDSTCRIYLNKQNSNTENLFSLAHCKGHLEFVNAHIKLKKLTKPRVTFDYVMSLYDQVEKEELDHFIITIRELAEICDSSKNPRYMNPLDYLYSQRQWFESWQLDLIKEITYEAEYFRTIQKTKLMNEGWASYSQKETLKEMNLTTKEKLEITQIEARLHYKPEEGLNYYSLGKALWSEVPVKHQDNVKKRFYDEQFIEQFYTEAVHLEEEVSVLLNQRDINSFQNVKAHLVKYFKHHTPKVYVDQEATNETGYLTFRYMSPYQVDIDHLTNLKNRLEKILRQPIYIKPLNNK
ncbi:hypothetical protein E3U55_07485 [Filobacillus milosensis]|uniref:SpoVR protein-like N-terminal domain-containing protein n=1 Tax=Filobacillus milosensis TaxID=94137 RepID=A0A4Y8IQC8_9BACI|nr:SpoVR family protein [Filobacillus milosensis]TFB22136.1 hypothetical protein E3U55_07485 [Filobacillus milosensis]